jgi:pimeloyl-ACP methyl ester carboxylesterase/uncharacterized RmlC-like cupin family protein
MVIERRNAKGKIVKFNCIRTLFSFVLLAHAAVAQPALPSTFQSRMVKSPEGAEIFVRSGGTGPVVVLLHGYAETSDSWAPLAADLVKDHTVVVPDLRGMGRSSRPEGGYDKKTQAADIRAVITTLGYDRVTLVAHDVGNMVAYAYSARYPDKVERFVAMDAPIPGVAPWDDIVRNPVLWHFSVRGPDAEQLVQGRERIYLNRIWNAFSSDPSKPDEATRTAYAAQFAQPGAMRAGFAQLLFPKDVEDNKIYQQSKLPMPVLAIGGEKSFGSTQAVVMRNVAGNVQEVVVPGAGHWLMEENPTYTIAAIRTFLDPGEKRITRNEFVFPSGAGTGTSGVSGIQTLVVKGNPDASGLYTILLQVPPHTRIAAHTHQDERVATVISGTWYLGYGEHFSAAKLKALPAGSFYTEPANGPHFAETRDDAVIVQITGVGPSSTRYVEDTLDPRPSGK